MLKLDSSNIYSLSFKQFFFPMGAFTRQVTPDSNLIDSKAQHGGAAQMVGFYGGTAQNIILKTNNFFNKFDLPVIEGLFYSC